ncbi:uncharacterized protein [Argopecten irradians]|uniref:uncharacterized protein isoform X2 n=1 Tax=Argopecten irradians TaxID=31199 RepID=UPI00371611C4
MRGKGKRPSRLSTSPYARNRSGSRASSAASQSESGPSTARVTAPAVASGGNGEQGPLSADQLEAVVEQVSARVAPQLVEAVHQAIEPVHVTPQPEAHHFLC